MSRNEAENKVWEVDSDIIARESARDRRETAAETVRRRKNERKAANNRSFLRV